MLQSINVWKKDAKCRLEKKDPDFFFPMGPRENAQAKRFCTDCKVVSLCRTYAIVHQEKGIWGGTDFAERKQYGEDVLEIMRHSYQVAGLLESRLSSKQFAPPSRLPEELLQELPEDDAPTDPPISFLDSIESQLTQAELSYI